MSCVTERCCVSDKIKEVKTEGLIKGSYNMWEVKVGGVVRKMETPWLTCARAQDMVDGCEASSRHLHFGSRDPAEEAPGLIIKQNFLKYSVK